jgi:hypothetical protein
MNTTACEKELSLVMLILMIEYVQCYWQSFALGMAVAFLWQHYRGKHERTI